MFLQGPSSIFSVLNISPFLYIFLYQQTNVIKEDEAKIDYMQVFILEDSLSHQKKPFYFIQKSELA